MSLREFVEVLRRNGELAVVSAPVDPYLEIAEIADRASKAGGPALLFERPVPAALAGSAPPPNAHRFTGPPMPVLMNQFGSTRRLELALGAPLDELAARIGDLVELQVPKGLVGKVKALGQLRELASFAPKVVSKAAFREVAADPPDLGRLPVLTTWPRDGGAFVTLPVCVTKDREGRRNAGMYRLQVFDERTTGMHWHVHHDGAANFRQADGRLEVAVALGTDPTVTYAATAPLPPGIDEFMFAGFLRGRPVELAPCATVDLEVPADAEIVIEGLVDPELLEPEGPFGESHGHVALEDFNMSMQVTAITRKRNAVFASIVSQVTPSESSVVKRVAYEPMFLAHLRDHLGVRGVRRVVLHEPLSNIRPIIFVQFAPAAPRTEVWRGLQAAATLRADCGKIVIAVSDDVDPTNTDAVMWSLAYRCNPGEDLHVSPHRSGGHGPKSGRREEDATLMIDATLKQSLPPVALPERRFMERAREIWTELGLPPLKPQAPWHGYSLGDWDARWDVYAERALAGTWADSGIETFARRRGGLTPETPARQVETPDKKG